MSTHSHLTQSEIQDLVNHYESEKRKLIFQLERTNALLSKLQNQLNILTDQTVVVNFDEDEAVADDRMLQQRSAPAPRKSPVKKQSIVERINQKSSGYRLSPWDAAIMEGIEQAGQPLINSELLRLLEQQDEELGEGLDEAGLKGKLNRSLHKLANKREVIVKLPYEGRGFMYALQDWVTSDKGLSKAYERAE